MGAQSSHRPGGKLETRENTKLRAGLDEAFTALARPAISYADRTIAAGSTAVKAAHVNEMRNAAK